MPSGFPSLDEYMLLKEGKGELVIIGGRPSMGKSAFMFQMAFHLAETQPVHIFSCEMDADQIRARIISGKINKSLTAIQRGYVDDQALLSASKELTKLQYYIDDRSGLSVYQLCDAARTAHKEIGTKCVVVDYLQLLHAEKSYSKNDEVGKITFALKDLARELKVPVIVGSQLSRNSEWRGKETGDYRPGLSDLRDSGSIEQDSDMVLFVHRQSRYTDERPGEADIIIGKNRNGPVGEVILDFCNAQTRFIDRGIGV